MTTIAVPNKDTERIIAITKTVVLLPLKGVFKNIWAINPIARRNDTKNPPIETSPSWFGFKGLCSGRGCVEKMPKLNRGGL